MTNYSYSMTRAIKQTDGTGGHLLIQRTEINEDGLLFDMFGETEQRRVHENREADLLDAFLRLTTEPARQALLRDHFEIEADKL